MFKKIAVAAVLATLAASSYAGTPGFYVGGEAGASKFDGASGVASSAGAVAGFNFNRNIGVEASIGYLGTVEIGGYGDIKYSQVAVSAIGSVPLNDAFSIYARLGYNNVHASYSGYFMSATADDNGFLPGLGVSYSFNKHFAGRIEFQRPASGITSTRAGFIYSF